MRSRPTLDDLVRAGALLVALALVGYLAVAARSEAAAGALIALVGTASSYLYRGRVQPPPGS